MTIKYSPKLFIPYPDKNEPPTISKHIEDLVMAIDSSMDAYRTGLTADFNKLKADEKIARDLYESTMNGKYTTFTTDTTNKYNQIITALQNAGWGVPITIAGTIATAGTGYTADAGSRAVKVGNMVVWTYKFRKTAAPAVVAGASGNISGALLVGTLSAACPTPTTLTPFTTMEDGYQLMGYLNTNKTLNVTALPPNTNLVNGVACTIGGMYMWNPQVP